MKIHALVTFATPSGKESKAIFCSSDQYNARYQRNGTDDWDKVTCKRCKPSLKKQK